MASKKELNPQDRQILEDILELEIDAITEDHAKILRARRDYLTREEAATFASVLSGKKTLDKMTKAELISEAEEAGVEVKDGMTNKELIAAIKEATK